MEMINARLTSDLAYDSISHGKLESSYKARATLWNGTPTFDLLFTLLNGTFYTCTVLDYRILGSCFDQLRSSKH